MKRFGVGVVAFVCMLMYSFPVSALSTVPSTTTVTKINGPLLITGYSFSGHSLRYVQIFNSSNQVVDLSGWRVSIEYSATQQIIGTLNGKIAPSKYVTLANELNLPTATFTFADVVPAIDPVALSISLLPPPTSNFNNEVASPSITSSTPRVAGTPATFYFARNTSTSTGNYLSTFTAFIPASNFSVISDALYVAPFEPELAIVEVYPDSLVCSPFEASAICSDYVKVHNRSDHSIDLSGFRLRTGTYGQTSSSSNTSPIGGTIHPGHFASFPLTLSSGGNWVWLEDAYGTVRYEQTVVQYPSSSGFDNQAWSYDQQANQWMWTIYPRPYDNPNQFAPPVAVNMCQGLVLSEVAANVATEDQFIEIHNPTSSSIDATGCAVQTNRSTTKSYVFTNTVVAPNQYVSVYVKDTSLTLTKTTSGSVYLLSSDLQNEIQTATYDNLKGDTSFAYINNVWLQTYNPTPDQANIWLEYPACEEGSIRNPITGLCNKIQTVNSLSSCAAGQYRNAETNRCRAITTASSLLVPCAANQERNPLTNRCRSIASASALTPCTANQERNPETNRCRGKTSGVVADFPVETIARASEATLGWWAFGGVGLLAIGYAGWEWRREALAAIKQVGRFVAGRF